MASAELDAKAVAGVKQEAADFTQLKSQLNVAYAAMLIMLIAPQFYLIHPYLHLLIMSPLLVWIGCQNSLVEAQKGDDSQVLVAHP